MAQQSYKKFVATAATATLVASAIVPVASANVTTSAFTDVPASYKDAVDFVVSKNIASGKTETQFGISQQITRGDAAIMIAAAAGLNDKDAPSAGFSDVPTRGALAVNSLKAAGVINGKTATKFGFTENITRGEAAIMLQKAFKLEGGDTKNSFTDVKDSYDAAVDALVANKVTNGINKTQFGTGNPIKRGDFAKFVYALKDQIDIYSLDVKELKANSTTEFDVKLAEALPADADLAKLLNVSVVLEDGTVVKPEATKVTVSEDRMTITVEHKNNDLAGLKGTLKVNGKNLEFDYASTVAIESVKATNAKTLTVTFNKPVTATAADFTVNKGTVKANVASVALSDDKKTATIEMASKLTEGEYTVSVAQKDADSLKGSVKVENEKVASIKVLSDVAPFTSSAKDAATVGVQVLNQYGEDITKLNYTDVTVTVAGAAAKGTLTSNGTLNLSNLSPIAKEGDNVILTLVHGKTGVAEQATVKLSAQPAISEITFGELYNKDGKTLTQDSDTDKDKFYLPVTTKDQYGNVVDTVGTINADVLFTNTNPGVATFSPVKTVTINGKDTNVVEVTGVNLDGTANLIAVSTKTGKSAQTAVNVGEGVKISSVALSSPTEVVSAGKDVYFPLTVVDTAGKEVKTAKELAAIKKDSVSTSAGSDIVEVEGKTGLFVKVDKASVIENKAVTVVVTTQSGKVATQSVVVKAAAVPTVITGLASKISTALRINDTTGVTINNTDLIVEDQYGQVITDKTKLADITFTATANPAGNATVTVTDPGSNKKSAKIVANPNATEKSSKVDFKLYVGAAEVEASTLTKTFSVVSDSQFESYSVEDIPTIYADATTETVVGAYNQEPVVKAKTASGEVVELVKGTDYTVTGQPATGDKITFADNATTAKKTVTITINRTGEELSKELTYSKVAPTVAKVQLVKNGTVTESNGAAKSDISAVKLEEVDTISYTENAAFDLEKLKGKVDFVITDTYGVSVAADETSQILVTLADTKELAAPTLTLSKVSGTVSFTNNGTNAAEVSSFTAGSEFNSVVKFGGVAGNTVKTNTTVGTP